MARVARRRYAPVLVVIEQPPDDSETVHGPASSRGFGPIRVRTVPRTREADAAPGTFPVLLWHHSTPIAQDVPGQGLLPAADRSNSPGHPGKCRATRSPARPTTAGSVRCGAAASMRRVHEALIPQSRLRRRVRGRPGRLAARHGRPARLLFGGRSRRQSGFRSGLICYTQSSPGPPDACMKVAGRSRPLHQNRLRPLTG
jgi:hypothetical protein